jgi:hypothetical protein
MAADADAVIGEQGNVRLLGPMSATVVQSGAFGPDTACPRPESTPRLEFGSALREDRREMAVDGFSAFIGEPKEDDARLVEDPESEDVAEIEIGCQDDA